MQKFKVNGQSVPKVEWKQTDGWTDGQTEAIALRAALMRSVIISRIFEIKLKLFCQKQIIINKLLTFSSCKISVARSKSKPGKQKYV